MTVCPECQFQMSTESAKIWRDWLGTGGLPGRDGLTNVETPRNIGLLGDGIGRCGREIRAPRNGPIAHGRSVGTPPHTVPSQWPIAVEPAGVHPGNLVHGSIVIRHNLLLQ